jgi:hypothetical protein
MPEMSGMQLVGPLRAQGSNMPAVIFVTVARSKFLKSPADFGNLPKAALNGVFLPQAPFFENYGTPFVR